ncbi:hypothetical protein ACOME3_005892 [Neoechinorhynchus agilis]
MTAVWITAADTVIVFDGDRNPLIDDRPEEKCNRIGNRGALLILRLKVTPSPYEVLLRKLTSSNISTEEKILETLRESYEDRCSERAKMHAQTGFGQLKESEVVKFDPDCKDFLRRVLCQMTK